MSGPITTGLPTINFPLNGFFHNGFVPNSAFKIPLALGEQRFSLQQSNSLLQMIQQNAEMIENPFAVDTMVGMLPWEQRQSGSNINENANDVTQVIDDGESWLGQWLKNAEIGGESANETIGRESPEGTEEMDQSASDEEEERYMKELEEVKKRYEELADDIEEEKRERFDDLELYTILLLPYLIFKQDVANYFVATEMLRFVLEKLGFGAKSRMLALLFIQCVDIVALSRGSLRLVDDYKKSWYVDIYNYMLTQLEAPTSVRVGTQIFMPQVSAPEYIER